jgi:hypothetical protein
MTIGSGGTSGRGLYGVGFWAQQQQFGVYSIDQIHILRPIWRTLPEAHWVPPRDPTLASWTQSVNLSLYFQAPGAPMVGQQWFDLPPTHYVPFRPDFSWLRGSTALTLPVPPDTTHVLRGILRSLPDQPVPPLLQQPAFQAYPPLYTPAVVNPPITKQFTELPQQPWRLDQTWTWSYNKNLIGQDQLPAGEQIYVLAPPQVVPDQIQLRSWQWSYNLSLIGKDRLPSGAQRHELAPSQVTPEQIQLHTWQWSYNLNLRGKDQLPIGEQASELAPSQKPPEQIALHSWQWSYNLNLIGKDQLPIGEQVWERPQLPIPPALTWAFSSPIEEIEKTFAQYDWPNPIPPYRLDQTWTASYNLNLIGQDKLPFRQSDWPNPIPPALVKDWIQQTNLALLTQPPVLSITISKYFDRPQLPVPPAQSWEGSYNKNLVGQDQLPFRQSDWPNPIAPLPPALTWIDQTKLSLIAKPFLQNDWPLTPAPAQPAQSWTASYNLNLIGQDRLPFRQNDWPLTPAAQRQVDLANWINRVQFQLQKPTAQYDWPNPIPPFRDPTIATIARGYNLDLIGQDQLPNRQQDWPNPIAPDPYAALRVWISSVNIALTQILPPLAPPLLMSTKDWPLARGPLQPDRGFSSGLNPNLPPAPPPVSQAVYNKTFLAGPGYLNVIPGQKPS